MTTTKELIEAVKRYQAAVLLVHEPYGWKVVQSTQDELLRTANGYVEGTTN